MPFQSLGTFSSPFSFDALVADGTVQYQPIARLMRRFQVVQNLQRVRLGWWMLVGLKS
jgi:hypothetical protein